MCRWFAYLGDEPQLLEDLILRPRHAVVKQVDEHFLPSGHTSFDPQKSMAVSAASDTGSPNAFSNMDGFGVGWFSAVEREFATGEHGRGKELLRPIVYTNIRPPMNDLVLQSIARGTSTTAIIAHVRAAPGLTPVVQTNCHPFTFGRHLFAHNGIVGAFASIRTPLLQYLPLRYQTAILGTTDAEHLGALYMFMLCGEEGDWTSLYGVHQLAEAMRKTIVMVENMQKEFAANLKVENTLNLVINSGSEMVALRYASPAGVEAPSLYYSMKAGSTMNRKYTGHPDDTKGDGSLDEESGLYAKGDHGRHAIVASEPSTLNQDEWDLVEPSQMVLVDENIRLKVVNM
ncbi:putative glutamine amidotransferase DUG3 [Colletotrichum siamense]|uniref:Glutamine amidotransferase DUG3 n=1 Tax=Colletotrichum siamense TaxID=690259 RepID=A0A9P5EG94_COLSI|nr:putative glutamine amidotransferase DUG3 [Colletotrichum siamense]KAF4851341.1 putative glutamine amidotransferase DUG3 [Colletotrichum siamense]